MSEFKTEEGFASNQWSANTNNSDSTYASPEKIWKDRVADRIVKEYLLEYIEASFIDEKSKFSDDDTTRELQYRLLHDTFIMPQAERIAGLLERADDMIRERKYVKGYLLYRDIQDCGYGQDCGYERFSEDAFKSRYAELLLEIADDHIRKKEYNEGCAIYTELQMVVDYIPRFYVKAFDRRWKELLQEDIPVETQSSSISNQTIRVSSDSTSKCIQNRETENITERSNLHLSTKELTESVMVSASLPSSYDQGSKLPIKDTETMTEAELTIDTNPHLNENRKNIGSEGSVCQPASNPGESLTQRHNYPYYDYAPLMQVLKLLVNIVIYAIKLCAVFVQWLNSSGSKQTPAAPTQAKSNSGLIGLSIFRNPDDPEGERSVRLFGAIEVLKI